MGGESTVEIEFYCSICNQNHRRILDSAILSKQLSFPHRYIDKHFAVDSKKEVYSELLLDKNFKIITVNSQFMEDAKKSRLMNEIGKLEEEFQHLRDKYKTHINLLKETITELKEID